MTSMIRPLPTLSGSAPDLPKLVHEMTTQDLEERYGRLGTVARVREARKRYCAEYNEITPRQTKLINLARIKLTMERQWIDRMPVQEQFPALESAISRYLSALKDVCEDSVKRFVQQEPGPGDVSSSPQEQESLIHKWMNKSDLGLARMQTIADTAMKRAQTQAKKPGKDAMQELANATKKLSMKFEKLGTRDCENCLIPAAMKALNKCSHCFTVYYCGKECQTATWKAHKAEWLKHDTMVQETLLGHKPQFVSGLVFTQDLCELISAYDHTPAKKS